MFEVLNGQVVTLETSNQTSLKTTSGLYSIFKFQIFLIKSFKCIYLEKANHFHNAAAPVIPLSQHEGESQFV